MTLYELGLYLSITVGLSASGFFLWKFRPRYYRRFSRESMPLWFLVAALFSMYLWIAVRIGLGLVTPPNSWIEGVAGLSIGAFIDVGLILWAVQFIRSSRPRVERRSGMDRRQHPQPMQVAGEIRSLLLDIQASLNTDVGNDVRQLGGRLEQNQKIMGEAIRYLVDTTGVLREVMDRLEAEAKTVAINLEQVQRSDAKKGAARSGRRSSDGR